MSFEPSTESMANRGARHPSVNIFRTSTFRQTLATLFLVWALLATAVVLLLTRQVDHDDDAAFDDLESQAVDWLRLSAEGYFEDHLALDPDHRLPLDAFDDAADPWAVYGDHLRQRLFDVSQGTPRLALAWRLRLFGLADDAQLRSAGIDLDTLDALPSRLFLEPMYDEVPEPMHDRLDRLADGDGVDEDEDEGWTSALSGPAVEILLSRHGWAEEGWDEGPEDEEGLAGGDACWALWNGDGERVAWNFQPMNPRAVAAEELIELEGWWWETGLRREGLDDGEGDGDGDDGEPILCRAQALPLAEGAVLLYGHPKEGFELDLPQGAAVALLIASLILAFAGSYRLALRTARFVEDLRHARSRLEGDTFPRLRRPGDGGDFDQAAGEINAILDRLDTALGSLTHVTDNIAHDLRTPLTRLQGQLDLLRRSDHPTDAMIGAVQEETQQLIGTFNALLRIAQVQGGNRRRGFSDFDFSKVIADVSELYAPAFADRGLDFQCTMPPQPVRQRGDADLWMQAVSNLIDNALKYTPRGGRVRLALHGGGEPQLILRDSGPGVPEGELEKVFERFYRTDRPHQQRGAGLGLSLVAAICKLHGATIELSNDHGLVVHLGLPKAPGQRA